MCCGSFGFACYNGPSQSIFLNSCNFCLNKRCLNQSEALQCSIEQVHFNLNLFPHFRCESQHFMLSSSKEDIDPGLCNPVWVMS